jgi:hypothetical protein
MPTAIPNTLAIAVTDKVAEARPRRVSQLAANFCSMQTASFSLACLYYDGL